jgi:hypothetical protein
MDKKIHKLQTKPSTAMCNVPDIPSEFILPTKVITFITIHKLYRGIGLTQLVCKWQHGSTYYKAIIRPFINLIYQVCTICIRQLVSINLQKYS